MAKKFKIEARPNPFTSVVDLQISYRPSVTPSHRRSVSTSAPSLRIYDTRGRLVADLSTLRAHHLTTSLSWDASHLPAGLYLLKAKINGKQVTKRLLLQR